MDREPHELRAIGEVLAFLRQPKPPGGWREAFEMLPLLKTVMAMKPKKTARNSCQEIVLKGEDIDLNRLPVQTCWPDEPGPLITWPLVVSQGPSHDDGDRRDDYNLGIYRMQVTGRNTTIMRWLKHRGGAQHHARWKEKKSEMSKRCVCHICWAVVCCICLSSFLLATIFDVNTSCAHSSILNNLQERTYIAHVRPF